MVLPIANVFIPICVAVVILDAADVFVRLSVLVLIRTLCCPYCSHSYPSYAYFSAYSSFIPYAHPYLYDYS